MGSGASVNSISCRQNILCFLLNFKWLCRPQRTPQSTKYLSIRKSEMYIFLPRNFSSENHYRNHSKIRFSNIFGEYFLKFPAKM